jgi:hypothetical protein
MTAPTTRATPKIALDQRAASRHDNAANIVLLARHKDAPARQWIKVLARADAARARYQGALGLAFPLVD